MLKRIGSVPTQTTRFHVADGRPQIAADRHTQRRGDLNAHGNAAAIGRRSLTLFERGANPNARDVRGWTALMYAGMAGQTRVMKKLLEMGADVHPQCDLDGTTALSNSIVFGDPTAVRLLLSKGADVDVRNKEGNTPLALRENDLLRHRRVNQSRRFLDNELLLAISPLPRSRNTARSSSSSRRPGQRNNWVFSLHSGKAGP